MFCGNSKCDSVVFQNKLLTVKKNNLKLWTLVEYPHHTLLKRVSWGNACRFGHIRFDQEVTVVIKAFFSFFFSSTSSLHFYFSPSYFHLTLSLSLPLLTPSFFPSFSDLHLCLCPITGESITWRGSMRNRLQGVNNGGEA